MSRDLARLLRALADLVEAEGVEGAERAIAAARGVAPEARGGSAPEARGGSAPEARGGSAPQPRGGALPGAAPMPAPAPVPPPAAKRAPARAAPGPEAATEELRAALAAAPSREEGRRLLTALKKPQLQALAAAMRIPVAGKDSLATIRDRLVEAAVGSRLDHAVLLRGPTGRAGG
jgi:hypothetical protein